jgi:hypothetical protein
LSNPTKAQINRDDRHLGGKHEPNEHDEEQTVPAGKSQAREREGRESAGDQLGERYDHSDLDAVHIDLDEGNGRVEHRRIILEVEVGRQEARRHPVSIRHCAKRHAEQPGERQQHGDAERRHYSQDGAIKPAMGGLRLHG